MANILILLLILERKNASNGHWLLAPNTLFHIKETTENVIILCYLCNEMSWRDNCGQTRRPESKATAAHIGFACTRHSVLLA